MVLGRLSRPPKCSASTQPQTSLVVSICSGHHACRTAKPQGCAEVVRDLKPLACYRGRIQPCTQRSSFVLVAAPNNSSFEAHISKTGLCRPVNVRSCSRSSQGHCSSFATTSPALTAAVQTRIPQGASETSTARHCPYCHLHSDGGCGNRATFAASLSTDVPSDENGARRASRSVYDLRSAQHHEATCTIRNLWRTLAWQYHDILLLQQW